MKKFWLSSRTILFNLSSGAILILLEYTLPFQSLLGTKGYQVAIAVVLISNLVLRSITTQAVTVHLNPTNQ